MTSNAMNKGTAIVGFVLSFVTGAGVMYAIDYRASHNQDAEVSADKTKMAGNWKQDGQIPLSAEDPIEGPVTAPVTIVEFADFQ